MPEVGVTVDGLDEVIAGFAQLADASDHLDQAMVKAGGVIKAEAVNLAPKKTGLMSRSIRLDPEPSGFTVTATSPYAYTFHAIALGKSKGGFTFYYPRKGGRKGYVRKARIPNNPFLFKAAEAKADEAVKVLTDTLDDLIRQATP